MRKFFVLSASALVLGLGLAQASALGQHGPTNADRLGPPFAAASDSLDASHFQAREPSHSGDDGWTSFDVRHAR